MRLVSAMFVASLALGTALTAPAQANVCTFPCFEGADACGVPNS